MASLLAAAGYRVHLLDRPGCCGALAAHAGETAAAASAARALGEALRGRPGILVATAAGCGAHVAGLDLPGVETRDLLVALEDAPRRLRFRDDPVTVAYQDACHLRHGLGLAEEPRAWLRRAGARVLEPGEADLCCGSAGTFNLARPEAAAELGRRKADRIRATGATAVVTANPGCVLQLTAHLRGSGVTVTPLARFLADRLVDPA
jgi:glycolate oxidase iron-sulfur subunit